MRKEAREITQAYADEWAQSSNALLRFDYDSVSPPVARFLKGQAARIQKYSTKAIIQIGKDLASAKHYLSHGAFLRWVENEVGIAARTAQGYMRVASWASDKSAAVALLPPSALYALSTSGVPKDFVDDVLRRAGEGERIQPSLLRAALKTVREPDPASRNAIEGAPGRLGGSADLPGEATIPALLSHAVEILAHALTAEDFSEVHTIMTSKQLLDDPGLPRMLERAFALYDSTSEANARNDTPTSESPCRS